MPYRTSTPSLALVALLLGCQSHAGGGVEPEDDAGVEHDAAVSDDAGHPGCGLGEQHQALTVIDRSIIGSPVDYQPDLGLRGRDDTLVHSMRSRREAAWQVVKRVLTPVALDGKHLPHVQHPSLFAFQTWHTRDDVMRIFEHAYTGLSAEQRKSRTPFSDAQVESAFVWNDSAIHDFPEWTAERIAQYENAVDDPSKASGLSGTYRVSYSPAASRHLLESYGDILRCTDQAQLPPSPPVTHTDETLFEGPVDVAACKDFALPAMRLTEDDTLSVDFTSTGGADVSVQFLGEFAEKPETCHARDHKPCSFKGPGKTWVSAHAGESALSGQLKVTRGREHRTWAPCLHGAFERSAVVVKADWRRAEFGLTLPTFDTTGAGLAKRLADGHDMSWTTPDGTANPDPNDIYTLTLPNGNVFRLAALHIMTKELDHWLWITLWWSDTPNSDFGEDRPHELPSIFSHYKMCTTVAFAEGDEEPTGGYAKDFPSLAAALVSTHRGLGGPTWCSNPFLEQGPGNAETNCLGCHQHAGTGLRPETIITDLEHFPEQGRTELRRDFPMDYSYAPTAGDNLAAQFRQSEAEHGEQLANNGGTR